MSTELAITAVTASLQDLLTKSIADKWGANVLGGDLGKHFTVTTLPLHKVREQNASENILNLFLYRTEVNAAWRNHPLPGQSANATPPLALNLDYLITAYGEDDREEVAHFFLGQAMRVLHDTAMMPRQRFFDILKDAHVHDQIERITITPRALSIEEISKLWSVFQTQYRVSAAYLVTVVLIESRVAPRTALPVLKRGEGDRGFDSLASPPPVLDSVKTETGFPAARLGEALIVSGDRLDMAGLKARVRHRLMQEDAEADVEPVNARSVKVKLPDPAAGGVSRDWPAGIYSLAFVVDRPDKPSWTTNEIAFALAPSITVNPTAHAAGNFEVTIDAKPQVRASQPVLVVWDDLQIAPKSSATGGGADDPTTVKFDIDGASGIHRVRLRVDGVDSIPIKVIDGGFDFDDDQSVNV
jgi:hypothetical protein